MIARYLVLGLAFAAALAAQNVSMGGFGGFGSGLYDGPSMLGRGDRGVGITGSESLPIRMSAGVRGTYNSNILGFSVDENGNYKPVASAGGEGTINVAGQHRFRSAYVGVNYLGGYSHYNKATFNNGSNQGINVGASGRLSSRWVLNGQGMGGVSNRVLGNVGFTSISEAEFIAAPLSELFDSRAYFLGVSASATYFKDRRNSFRFSGNGSTVRRKARSLADMQAYGASGDWVYRLNQRTSLGVSYQFSHYDFFKIFGDTDIHMIGLHTGRSFGRDWQVTLAITGMQQSTVGVRRINLDPVLAQLLGRSSGTEVFESNNLLYGGQFQVRRIVRRTTISGGIGRTVTPGNGFFVSSVTEQIDFSVTYASSRRSSINFNAGHSRMSSLGFASGKLKTSMAGGSFSYRLMDALSLDLSADGRSFELQQTQFARKGYQVALGIGYHPSRGLFSTR